MGETLSDGHFLQRWHAARDGEAFYELVRRHSGMVYATCLRMLRNSHDAEEVVQDTFLALAESQPHIESYAGPWLHRVAMNRCLDRLKVGQRREQRERAAGDTMQSSGTVSWDDLQDLVDEAIYELPETDRTAIVAHFLEGQTHEAIAESLGLTRQAVSHRIKRGIEATREALRKRGVTITAGTLSILFAENAQATVPPALAASLGKMSLAGAKHVAASGMVSGKMAASPPVLSAIVGVKTLAVVGIVFSVAAIGWYHSRGGVPATSPTSAIASSTSSSIPSTEEESVPATAGPTADTESAPPRLRGAADSTVPASISGKVTDTKGNPLAGVQISVFTPGILLQGPGLGAAELARLFADRDRYTFSKTGSDGTYTISRVHLPGTALVGANAPGYAVVERKSHELELHAGEVLEGIDFVVETGMKADGIIVAEDGHIVRDGIVVCTDTGVALKTAADGKFSLGLPQGYTHPTLLVVHDVYGMHSFEDFPIPDGHDFELVLRRFSSIRGQIKLASLAPAAGYEVRLEAIGTERGTPRALVPRAKTDEDGSYIIDKLPSNNYMVRTYGPDGSAVSGPIDVGLLKPGESRVWNYVVEAPMRVYGTVLGEIRRKPIPNQHVAWTVDGRVAGSVMTDAKGRYRLTNFASPGAHLIVPNTTFLDIHDDLPDEWRLFAEPIQTAPGAELAADLFLPDTFAAAVRFLDENDRVVTQGIRVNGVNTDESGRSNSSTTLRPDAAGRYVWDGFSSQLDCSFQAWPNEDASYIFVKAEVPFPSSLDEIVEVTARIYRWAELEGVLLAPDGAPLANEDFTIELKLANREPYVLIGGSTDENGYFHIQGDPSRSWRAIPATPFSMRVKWQDAEQRSWMWTSGPLHPNPGETVSLGHVQLGQWRDLFQDLPAKPMNTN